MWIRSRVDLRDRLDDLLDEYRATLRASVESLSEVEARARLVPSKTTLLGLLKHVTLVWALYLQVYASSPSTPGTPTFCASRSSPLARAERPTGHRPGPWSGRRST
jgi:hypothetical protein